MTSDPDAVRQRLDRVVRRERGRLIAGLVARLGPTGIELAEDVAQDAMLAALKTWPYRGMPDNPGAWLARVAGNKAVDRLRRARREVAWDADDDPRADAAPASLFAARVDDPELRLVLLCCHDGIGDADRIALTLRIAGGFTAREIAQLFLVSTDAMSQRLARARRRCRDLGIDLAEEPSPAAIRRRLDAALKTVYLMFSLGYAPRCGGRLARHDVAREAIRLARELAAHRHTATPAALALAALLCLHGSRLAAREDEAGNVVRLADQDRAAWDTGLVGDGLRYLAAAQAGNEVTRYHLEAGIAAAHATAPDWQRCDWASIVALYERLEAMTGSPVVAVNAAVARAMNGDADAALHCLEAVGNDPRLVGYSPYFLARAEVLAILGRSDDARRDFERAIDAGAAEPVLRHIERRLDACL